MVVAELLPSNVAQGWQVTGSITMTISEKQQRTLRVAVCHAPEDTVRAYRLYNLIKRVNVSPWLAEEDLRAGQDFVVETCKAIRNSDVVIIGLSRQAVEQS